MIHFKSRSAQSGFMLTEVLLTIAIVGMVIMAVLMMQTNALRGLQRYSSRMRLFFPAKNFLMESIVSTSEKKGQEVPKKKEITNPKATLTYTKQPVGKDSVFKDIHNLHRVKVAAQSRRAKESIVRFIYQPERKKQ